MLRITGTHRGCAGLHALAFASALVLAGCGGGDAAGLAAPADAARATTQATASAAASLAAALPDVATTSIDAARLAQQGSFGPTEPLIDRIAKVGPRKWIALQMEATPSEYPALGNVDIDRWTSKTKSWCQGNFTAGTPASNYCWRDYYSSTPVAWHFYRQAVSGEDQLRQRVAFALSQWIVASDVDATGTYGLRDWAQMFRDNAFGNYRDLLRAVVLSPVMGVFLNNVNNSKTDPNENFARELLQLFSIGTCALNHDGTLKGGSCQPTYDNATVREYAYALTGWTFPAGGVSAWCGTKCNGWQNPRWLKGSMVAVPAQHDQNVRKLLSGVTLAASRTPGWALSRVLDSIMAHDNVAPFVATRLIQHLVTGNPSPAYVSDVATAFETGSHAGFGSGKRGDLAATVAAVLLHDEARTASHIRDLGYGRLREPAQVWTGLMRALDATTDGAWFGWSFGGDLGQTVFSAPSVFGHYPPDYLPAGAGVVAPAFALEDENTTFKRLGLYNYVNFTGTDPVMAADATVAGSTGTAISHARYLGSAGNPSALVSRLDLLLTSRQLSAAQRQSIVDAVSAITESTHGSNWKLWRVRVAMFLVMASPQYAVIR
ncbi:DUF1800 domain-containing protein [Derxia gummosa]|uniref:DUF1800 domain-containing protein n=1 Tax=Derxia gummosa DSM 723 TaxID=1121388 RepID=A0A8B6X306_9BURK|nr:DUF1800 family protein [Derxia gummosa]